MPDIIVGENSYVALDTANTYMASRLFTDTWNAADDDDRESALIMATRAIDRLTLVGRPAVIDQTLAFPRTTRALDGTDVDTDDIPQAVTDATCEEALALLDRGNNERRKLQSEGVTSFQIGTLSEAYATGQSGRSLVPRGLVSIEARELLSPYIARSVRIV